MATIPTVSHGAYPQSARRIYMSIRAFNGSFFSYTTTRGSAPQFEVTGTLAAVTGATSGNCPAGRTLRENGKKLYPGANPGISTYMVGVYDANSGLSGFIDPNDAVFTVYNTDKPTYMDDGISPTNSAVDKAPGVYAIGDIVTTAGNITTNTGSITTTNGNITATSGSITAGAYITGSVTALPLYATGLTGVLYTNGVSADVFIDPFLGNVYTVNTTPATLTTSLNVYCAGTDGVAITPPSGTTITLVVKVGNTSGGNTLDIVGGNGIKMNTVSNMVVNTVYTVTFVSDGVKLLQTAVVGGYAY